MIDRSIDQSLIFISQIPHFLACANEPANFRSREQEETQGKGERESAS